MRVLRLNEDEEFLSEANRILHQASARKLGMRLMGGAAFRLQCPNHIQLFAKMRRELADIDFMASSKDHKQIQRLFTELGYTPDKRIMRSQEYGLTRFTFYAPNSKLHVDVFFDQLKMCHKIDLRKRLDLEDKTISLSDMLLQKMQIVKLNEKDAIDALLLLLEHEVSDNDNGINAKYISKLMSEDWGFYYTFTTNLKRTKEYLDKIEFLSVDEKRVAAERVDRILKAVEAQPKSVKWRMRSKIGTKQQWYDEILSGM